MFFVNYSSELFSSYSGLLNSLSHYFIVELGLLMQTEVKIRVSCNGQTADPRKSTKMSLFLLNSLV